VLRRSAISFLLSVAILGLPAFARTRPHYGGTLRVETAGDAWQGSNAIARRLVFEGLTTLDARGAVKPALAANWQTDDNGHHWQFRLRSGIHFHDASPLTTSAVVQSLTLACASNCPWTSAHAVGSTVVFTSDSPLPNLPDLLASDLFLISLPQTATAQAPNQFIGTGPYQVVQSTGNMTTLSANESSWQGRPFIDQITITAHRPIRDQWLDLTLGRTDLVDVPPEQLRQAQQQRLSVATSRPVTALVLQLSDSGVLANPDLRTAVALAVDRSAISNVIFQKQGEITASLVPESTTGYAFLFQAERDLNKANEARGGLTPGTISMSADADGVMQLTSQRLALNLREAGFNVRMAAAGSTTYSDIVLRNLPVSGSDAAGVLGRLLLAAGQSPAMTAQNPQFSFRAEQEILDRHLIIPLIDLPRAYAVGARVRDFALDGYGNPDLAGASLESAP
jgi:peptide/nickel transport system substrate-binding protein